jgi:hypothetical protein
VLVDVVAGVVVGAAVGSVTVVSERAEVGEGRASSSLLHATPRQSTANNATPQVNRIARP